MYIAIKNDDIYKGTSLHEIIKDIFDIDITDSGFILIDGKPDSISYSIKDYNKAEMLTDFMTHRANQLLKRQGYKLYKEIEL